MLDGSWGVMIQRRELTEEDFRGERFRDHSHPQKGNNDLLILTRPDIIADLHDVYYAAGADISRPTPSPRPPSPRPTTAWKTQSMT